MPTEAKRATIAELRQDLAGSTTLITTEYRGLKVREIGEIRRALRKNNVTYRVVKNRLMRIAAEQEGNAGVAPLLRGPSAIAFGSGLSMQQGTSAALWTAPTSHFSSSGSRPTKTPALTSM